MKGRKILLYQTNAEPEDACAAAMSAAGCTVVKFYCPLSAEEDRERFLPAVRQLLREQRPDMVFAFVYEPALSDACLAEGILYAAYSIDAPAMAVLADNLSNDCNLLISPDSQQTERLLAAGAANAAYLPLAPGLGVPETGRTGGSVPGSGGTGVSFVGGRHSDNLYSHFSALPDQLRGYLDAAVAAQAQVYGCSLFDSMIEDALVDGLKQLLPISQAGDDTARYRYLLTDLILPSQTTKLERTRCLKELAQELGERFVWYSREAADAGAPGCRGPVSYGAQLAEHYAGGYIHLNMTNRCRSAGVPQRCWDILACGGLLLSNYQADFSGLLEAGRDFVQYG
ncbi:MAG: glycosyltransferase, partial [Lachnospiraceae bacterium]|nr:glycosyltransferase [Lachnospiraceae bacterium]